MDSEKVLENGIDVAAGKINMTTGIFKRKLYSFSRCENCALLYFITTLNSYICLFSVDNKCVYVCKFKYFFIFSEFGIQFYIPPYIYMLHRVQGYVRLHNKY